jgi:hypothetical protein
MTITFKQILETELIVNYNSKKKGDDLWNEYDKARKDLKTYMNTAKVDIGYIDIYRKGFKSLMGPMKAMKKNIEEIQDVINNKKTKITLYSF